jgi:predicted nucleic acid-binding protein
MIGLDTGFFVKLSKNNSKSLKIWQGIVDGDDSVVSCMTLFELKRLSLKGSLDADDLDHLIEAIMSICKVIWLDNLEISNLAANISHGTGIPAIDSLIIAGFILSNVKIIYTTDSHLKLYQSKKMQILIL